jgi:hypothetical protein
MYAIVIEEEDGTVKTVGPYVTWEAACRGVTSIAEKMHSNLNIEDWGIERKDREWIRLESVGDETIDVYAQLMQEPER